MARKFRKKPVVIDAVQFTGENDDELREFCPIIKIISGWEAIIPTKEGEMMAGRNDWIIKGIAEEFYPCKPDIFARTYEEA